jgi:drug/metabolite transporter (DMT)-like permease
MAALILAWGINWPVAKIVLEQVHPLVHRAIVLSLGGVCLLALARGAGHHIGLHPAEAMPFLGMTVFNVTGFQALATYGLYFMPAGRASIIGNSTPIFVAMLAPWLLRTRITAMELLGILLGLGGLVVLIAPDAGILATSLFGALLLVAAAVSSALGAICMKLHQWRTPSAVLTGWSILIGSLPICAAVVWLDLGMDASKLGVEVWLALAYTLAISTILGNWLWFRIITILPAQKGAMAMFCIPAVGVLSGALILNETVAVTDLLSLVLVVGGMLCTFHRRAQE